VPVGFSSRPRCTCPSIGALSLIAQHYKVSQHHCLKVVVPKC
jgi:hypothetical protein